MKLLCSQSRFKKAILNAERVIGKQLSLPILENILLETERGMLKISSTNLELGVVSKIGAKIEKEGKITIPARLISSFVNNLPENENLKIETSGLNLKITSGKYVANIKGLDAQDFPIIPEITGNIVFLCETLKMKEVLPKILISVSLDNTRPELSGVNLIFGEKEVFLASTDSFRLAEAMVPIKIEGGDEYNILKNRIGSVIIPAPALSEIWHIIDSETEKIGVLIEESQIFFQIDGVRLVSRLINGKYPEYKQIIPKEFKTQVLVEKESLLRAVRLSSFFTQNKGGEVVLKINPSKGEMEIKSQSEDKGENETIVGLTGSGIEQEIIFNPKYLLDGINAISDPTIELKANNNQSPVIICSPQKEVGFFYVVMPIRK